MPRVKLKTKLVLAISGMVSALVVALSCIYVSQLIRQRLTEADANAFFVAHQVLDGARKALETDLNSGRVDLSDPARLHKTIAGVLQADAGLNSLLQSIVGYSPTIYDAAIADNAGRGHAAHGRGGVGQAAAAASRFQRASARRLPAPDRRRLRRSRRSTRCGCRSSATARPSARFASGFRRFFSRTSCSPRSTAR